MQAYIVRIKNDSQKRLKGDFIDQVIDILEEKFPQIPSDKIKDLGDTKQYFLFHSWAPTDGFIRTNHQCDNRFVCK